MDRLQFKNFVTIFFENLNKRDYEKISDSLSENVCLDFPYKDLICSKDKVMTFLKALHRKYDILEFVLNQIIVEENNICVIWNNSGITRNGENYSNRGITLIKINQENNLIEFMSDYFKNTVFPK